MLCLMMYVRISVARCWRKQICYVERFPLSEKVQRAVLIGSVGVLCISKPETSRVYKTCVTAAVPWTDLG